MCFIWSTKFSLPLFFKRLWPLTSEANIVSCGKHKWRGVLCHCPYLRSQDHHKWSAWAALSKWVCVCFKKEEKSPAFTTETAVFSWDSKERVLPLVQGQSYWESRCDSGQVWSHCKDSLKNLHGFPLFSPLCGLLALDFPTSFPGLCAILQFGFQPRTRIPFYGQDSFRRKHVKYLEERTYLWKNKSISKMQIPASISL